MFLAFSISDMIRIPFGYLLDFLYQLTTNYGAALIIFAILVKIILLPFQAKSKKSMMKMSRLTPQVQKIQAKYADDTQKQNEAMQALYREEGVSMGGGCLWSFLPLFILLPLYHVIRQPITYMLHETVEVSEQIVSIIKTADSSLFSNNNYYDQLVAARHLPDFAEAVKAAIPALGENTLTGINFDFLGIDLGAVANWKFWTWDRFSWANIGAFLIPLLSAGSQMLQMWISQNQNNSLVTNEKGVQDKEAAKNSQQNQSTKMMMWMFPLMSLWIGFTVPAALSLYWFIQGILSMIQEPILTNHYRKIYDEEDAQRLKRYMAEEAAAAERERVRAERRAANPEGQTQNTSKKKLQKKLQQEEEAAKAAAAREYASKKGISMEEAEENSCMSGIPSRPYCKGRNYDPNRYNTEE